METHLRAISLLQPHLGYPVHTDRHDFHEMIVVLRGRYRAESCDTAVALEPGDAVIYPSGVAHQVSRGQSDAAFYCLQWNGPDDLGNRIVLAHDRSQRLAMAARWLHDLYHRPGSDPAVSACLLTALVAEVGAACGSTAEADHDALESVRRVLLHNFDKVQSLTNLSNLAGLSPSQLSRSFRQRFGCSVMTYLRQVRIEAALAMLTCRQATLQEIAEACGFNRSSYLVRVIREHTGLTPGQIRSGIAVSHRSLHRIRS